jgi:hypothetical protein
VKNAFKKGSVAMIYIPSFIKTGSGVHKLLGDTRDGHCPSLLEENRLKNKNKEEGTFVRR